MLLSRRARWLALGVVLSLHVWLIVWWGQPHERPAQPRVPDAPVQVTLVPAPPLAPQIPPTRLPSAAAKVTERPRASQAAPTAPTAQDWAFASGYTLKNSKGYRHNWGRQVRSMMGTAVEGPDQGMVRFRVELAPNGTLAKLETLWSTSPVAEQKAREAMAHMPPLPPTPTGKPLVFERTIVFSPFAHDDTPLYRHDCELDVPAFRNRYTWDGQSAKMRDDDPPPPQPLSPEELEACLKQLPPETVQSESARDQRVMDRWGTTHRGQEKGQ